MDGSKIKRWRGRFERKGNKRETRKRDVVDKTRERKKGRERKQVIIISFSVFNKL